MTSTELSSFLENFLPLHLQHMRPESHFSPWVFWRGSENISCSADRMIYEKIKDVLVLNEVVTHIRSWSAFAQFWAPVTTGSRLLLSTLGRPFAVSDLSTKLAKYRIDSEIKYQDSIDVNMVDDGQGYQMRRSRGPATAYLSQIPYIYEPESDDDDDDDDYDERLNVSCMLPICFLSQTNCIGVIELCTNSFYMRRYVLDTIEALKKAGLDVFHVQRLIPYETRTGLKLAKDKIEIALKAVCELYYLPLAQVWISYEDTQTKRMLALRLYGNIYEESAKNFEHRGSFFKDYRIYDVVPLQGEELARKTLIDHESRYVSNQKTNGILYNWEHRRALVICLRSIDTGDFYYALEFLWAKRSNATIMLESILLTLKRCLPRFQFASGAKLDDASHVIDVASSADTETNRFIIFDVESCRESVDDETINEEPRQLQMEKVYDKRKKPMDANYKNTSPSEVKRNTNRRDVSHEEIKKQFGKTMEEAAKNLGVSKATLKRRWIEYFKNLDQQSKPWPGPRFCKKNVNDSSVIQIDTDEEVNKETQEPSTKQINVTVEAKYAGDLIKFPLSIMDATFLTLEEKIGLKYKLSVGTYKLKYRDEAGREILLTSDEEMSFCIESSRKSDGRIVVQVSVVPYTPY